MPFSKDAKAIAEAARVDRKHADAGAVMLLEDHDYQIDAKGLRTSTLRYVYLVQSADAVEFWASVEHSYRPWYEDRPQLRARVISNLGEVHTLDPKTIADAPVKDFDDSIFSDRRMVRAPLPAVAAGTVVEYEVVARERLPLLDAGQVSRIDLRDYVPTERFHIVIQADKAVPLKIDSFGLPDGALRQSTVRGGSRVEMEVVGIEVPENRDYSFPADVPEFPFLAFSTGTSWQAVATRYHSIVEEKLATPVPAAWLEGGPREGDAVAIATAVAARLHKEIRYTGVEFGDAAIVPRTPAETLARKYGDCKDKSVLMVGALRAAGLKASLALLSAGLGADVPRELPGLGLFNHAIVYVDANPPLWIDATAARTRVGVIPTADQGRLALIIRPETVELVPIPESSSNDNWSRTVIDVRMADYGFASVEETMEAGGVLEEGLRARFESEPANQQKQLEDYAGERFVGNLDSFSIPDAGDLTVPFRVSIRVKDAKVGVTALDDAVVGTHLYAVFGHIPYALLAEKDDDDPPRSKDFLFPEPHRNEIVYRIHLPPFFKPGALPPPVDLKFGDTSITKTYTLRDDGVLELLSRVDTGKRRIAAAEFAALREGIAKHRKVAPEFLSFVPLSTDLLALGKSADALEAVRTLVESTPGKAIARIRRSKVLLGLGLGLPARSEAVKATELEPGLSVAWLAAGFAWQHSSTGKSFQGDWKRDEAERAYRKAIELDPGDTLAKTSLAILLEHNARGFRYTTGPQLHEAAELYRQVLKERENPVMQQNLAFVLLYAGDFDKARVEIEKSPADNRVFMELILAGAEHGAARVLTDPRLAGIPADSRAAIFARIAFSLIVFRKYDDVKALAEAAGRLGGNSAMRTLTAFLGDLRRHDELLVSAEDPRYPVQRLIMDLANGNLSRESAASYSSSYLGWHEAKESLDVDSAFSSFRGNEMIPAGLTNEVLLDFALGKRMEPEGDDATGFKISAMLSGARQFFVIREGNGYKLLGGPDSFDGVGRYILHLIGQGNVAAAQSWLDKVVNAATLPGYSVDLPAVRSLWSGVGEAARGPDTIRLAAASLIGTYSKSPEAAKILLEGRAKAKSDFDRAMIDLALAETYSKAEDWKSLLPVAKRLSQTKAFGQRGFAYTMRAAAELQDWQELESAGALGYATNERNQNAIEAVVTARARMGDLRAAKEWLAKLKGDPDNRGGSDRILDNRTVLLEAWIAMHTGTADKELLAKLEDISKNPDAFRYETEGYLTIAMLRAVLNKPGDGVEPLFRALGEDWSGEPNATFWAVYARICRDLGFTQAAVEAAALAREKSKTDDYTNWALSIANI